MQLVYVTARPDLLAETLGHVRHFAPEFDDVVVATPARLAARVADIDGVGTVVTDEDLTGRSPTELGSLGHPNRNYLLRSALARHDAIDDVFVMSDDDSRPLASVPSDFFVAADGRHRRRWFHTMSGWRHRNTEYDESILHTWVLLRQMGIANPLSFSSHMPQVYDKAVWGQVVERFAAFADTYAIDEWSSYFNLGPTIAPERFAEPEPFVTLGWPQYPGEWAQQIEPPANLWENHHPELHESEGLYGGLASSCDPDTIDATNIEKMIRWWGLDRQVRDLAFPDDVDQPWTTDSAGRKLAFKGLRAARSAYRYVALDDRARIAELEGRMERLERD